MPKLMILTLNPEEWLTYNFSLHYYPRITHQGHEKKGNDHQAKKLTIVQQILHNVLLRKCKENIMEIMHI